jgi:hypothetical protein
MRLTLGRRTLLAFAVVASLGQAAVPEALIRARQFYNDQKYDAAIAAASEARGLPGAGSAAALVLARAHLERYRQTADAADLVAARDALSAVRAAELSAREQSELFVGLGESLYLDGCADGCYSGAAELFDLAMGRAEAAAAEDARDTIFEWWAGALDRQAQFGLEAERKPIYSRILARAESELRRRDTSVVAAYWLAAAARGTGDFERAWGAAVAGWVRAPYLGTRGVALRADLDRFVIQVLLPERARQLAGDGDPRPVFERLLAQWLEVKAKYLP